MSATWETVVLTVKELAPKLWLLFAIEVYGTNPPELVSYLPTENRLLAGRFILSNNSGGKIEAILLLPESSRIWGLLWEFFEDECIFTTTHTVGKKKG